MKKRVSVLVFVAVMAASLVSGCGSKGGNEKKEPEKSVEKVFNMPIGAMPGVLAPTDGTNTAMTYLQAMYERLYCVNAEGEYTYFLAESCDVSEDSLTYTIKLRDDAVWSDGTPITSDDVVFTVDYYQNFAQSVVSTLTSGYTAEAVDEKTVKLVLEKPVGSFYDDFGGVRLMPAHVFENNSANVDGSEKLTGTEVVTSGPYTIAEWNAGESMILKAREDYYRGKAGIETLNFVVMPEENSQELAFENGELSCIEISNAESYEKYSSDENYNTVVFPAGNVVHLQYNPDGQEGKGLSDDERLAVELAISREEIAKTAYGSEILAEPAHSCFATTQAYYNKELTHKQDTDKAKELVSSTGMKDKTITIIYNNLAAGVEDIAVVIQQELTQAGLNVQVQGYDAAAFYGRVFHAMMGAADTAEATDWDYAIGSDSGLYGDSSSAMVTYSTMKLLGEEGSAMMLQAYAEPDEAKREELFKKAQAVTDEANVFIPLVETNEVLAAQKNVTGIDKMKIKPVFVDYWALGIE